MTLEERFWKKVKKTKGCWNWTASLNIDNYGNFSFKGKTHRANRISYMFTYGKIPKGLYVLHKCDNPKCVRPSHLFLGTPKDNMKDRDKKGRQYKGTKHHSAKLTEKEVKEIRKLYLKTNISQRSLAKEFNVCQYTIFRIVNNTLWKHI